MKFQFMSRIKSRLFPGADHSTATCNKYMMIPKSVHLPATTPAKGPSQAYILINFMQLNTSFITFTR